MDTSNLEGPLARTLATVEIGLLIATAVLLSSLAEAAVFLQ